MQLKCLSIQQPFAEMIISGRKRVENRTWTWMKDRNWKEEGPVLLGIHASRKIKALSDEELDDYFPSWRENDEIEIGAVLGVVDLLGIYRAKDLPPDLRALEFTNKHADNWCWVVANPRRLSKPFDATGNARLFNVDVPDNLLPKELSSENHAPQGAKEETGRKARKQRENKGVRTLLHRTKGPDTFVFLAPRARVAPSPYPAVHLDPSPPRHQR